LQEHAAVPWEGRDGRSVADHGARGTTWRDCFGRFHIGDKTVKRLLVLFTLLVTPATAQVFDYPTISPVPLKPTEAEQKWFQTQFVQNCCNLGHAYVVDEAFEKDGKYYVVITDGFDHHPDVLRPVISPGTIREIPKEVMRKMSMKDAQGNVVAPRNPSSHGILFLHLVFENGEVKGYKYGHSGAGFNQRIVKPEEADVLCYWPGAGI
jgi:hypothetical protein